MKSAESYKGVAPGTGKSGQDFLRKRLAHFGLTMIVMGICFALYYLGFFGAVDGPLNPARLGKSLAGIGIAKIHVLALFVSLLIIAVTWNWIFNWISLLTGSRLTCKKKVDNEGSICGAPALRKKVVHKKTGRAIPQYECINGHKLSEAYFHPVKKGTLGHTLWVISFLFCLIIFFPK
jgi:hypothetical protein